MVSGREPGRTRESIYFSFVTQLQPISEINLDCRQEVNVCWQACFIFFLWNKVKILLNLMPKAGGSWLAWSKEATVCIEKKKKLRNRQPLKMAALGIFSLLAFLPVQFFPPRVRELFFSPLFLSSWELKPTELISSSLSDQ